MNGMNNRSELVSLYQMAKDYVSSQYPGEEVRAQSANSWCGPFVLPKKLMDYYQQFGPVNLELGGSGSPFYLPRLSELWQYQAGYGYDPRTGGLRNGWDRAWLAIGDDGNGPFIFSLATGQILFDPYCDGRWEPVELFSCIEEMVYVLCIISSVTNYAGDDLCDSSLNIKRKYKEDAFLRVVEVTGCLDRARYMLMLLSWS